MSLPKLALLYAACAATFFAIDLVWLSFANSRIYAPRLGDLLAKQPKLGVAAGFYALYVVGLIALAVLPGVREGAVMASVWRGALFGLVAYATYDLTNLATLEGWPWQIALLDMVWGTALNASVSAVGYFAAVRIGILGS